MSQIRRLAAYPENTLIVKDMVSVDYFDSYLVENETSDSVEQVMKKIFALPTWIRLLLYVRYLVIVKPFGLRTGSMDEEEARSDEFHVPLLFRNENEIVVGDDDKHLYYRISVMKMNHNGTHGVALSTAVMFHNRWGRIYFAFIKPFHKLVVKSMLKKI